MYKIRLFRLIIALAFLLAMYSSTYADSYDPETSVLTIPSVQVGSEIYTNIDVKLDKFSILKFEGPSKSIPCSHDNFSLSKFDSISPYLTLEQVNKLIGCDFDPSLTSTIGRLTRYVWTMPSIDLYIQTFFHTDNLKVATKEEIAAQIKLNPPSVVCGVVWYIDPLQHQEIWKHNSCSYTASL